ncbi:MAG: zf-HC2 domain-containing protein [Pseudomonadales bacterium]
MHKLTQNQHEHDDVLELLPWHLNNTLNAEESERVRSHLQQCVACQQEAELLTTALDAANTYAPIPSNPEDRFDTLMARIEETEAENSTTHTVSAGNGIGRELSIWWQGIVANIGSSAGWGAAIAAGVLVAVIGFQSLPSDDAPYETVITAATGDKSPLALRIQFKDAITRAEARQLLQGSGVEFALVQEDAVNYIVSLPNDAPVAALNTLLQALSTETEIANVAVALDLDN